MAGKYHGYFEYKEASAEWLESIPSHWVETSLKRYCRVTDGSHHSPKIKSSGKSFVSVTDVGVNNINFEDSKKIADEDYLRLVQEGCKPNVGDVLLTKDGTIGRAAIVYEDYPDFVILSSLGLLTPIKKLSNVFLYYYLVSGINVDQMNSMIHGSALRRMTISKVDNLLITIPPLDEQERIAKFLDHETAKIDTLIEKQQQLIKLLKEKRQTVISHAVTKGLTPDAPMRDSGVEWLGEVPAHWSVIYIKHLSTVKRGASPRPIDDQKYFDENGEYSWVRIADVSKAGMYLTSTTQRLSDLGASLSVKLEPDQLFVSIAGTVGKPCITISKACIHDGFVYFPELKINNKFLYYIFEAGEAYLGLGKMGTQLNLNTETVGGIKVGLPPLNEIYEIVTSIEHSNEKYDDLISKANKSIGLMQERRTALISAAVTGKIDVRNWQAPQQKQNHKEEAA